MLDQPVNLDGGNANPCKPIYQYLLTGVVFQFLSLFFAGACVLDLGECLAATARISVAYWVGAIIVLARRSNFPTSGDCFYLRFGLLPLLIIGVPITVTIWQYRHLC